MKDTVEIRDTWNKQKTELCRLRDQGLPVNELHANVSAEYEAITEQLEVAIRHERHALADSIRSADNWNCLEYTAEHQRAAAVLSDMQFWFCQFHQLLQASKPK